MKSTVEPIRQYELTTATGFSASVLNYGAILQSIKVPTESGLTEVLLGYQQPQTYLDDDAYMGAIAGRYCNRIADGLFTLSGKAYQLSINSGAHHLHGGTHGLSHKYWQLEQSSESSQSITLKTFSPDSEQGYPGNVQVEVTYTLQADNKLIIDMKATTDKITPFNLTGHAYFNLNTDHSSAINHHLKVYADKYLPIDDSGIPTGELLSVAKTPFDFRELSELSAHVNDDSPAVASQKGIDHNFVLNDQSESVTLAAELYSPQSGVHLKVHTNKPGLQIYTGNHLSGDFEPYQGVCLEPQYYPNSPNQSEFPECFLKPGDTYHHQIIYEFLNT